MSLNPSCSLVRCATNSSADDGFFQEAQKGGTKWLFGAVLSPAPRYWSTDVADEVRSLVHDPATGLAGREPQDTLAGIAEAIPLLGELKDRYLAGEGPAPEGAARTADSVHSRPDS